MINKRALLKCELCNACAAGLTKKITWHKWNNLTTMTSIGSSEDDIKQITGFLFLNHIKYKIFRK
jgi:hypothetical protein